MMRGQGKRYKASGAGGQSTLEYILILAAVLVAIIVAANNAIRPAVNTTIVASGNVIENAAGKLKTGLNLQ